MKKPVVTRKEQDNVLLYNAEQRFGFDAPIENKCINFVVCCEMGTELSCNYCKWKNLKRGGNA